ncbi:MAG TPA: SRPBCC family protein [Thermomicrobiales bacterium]|nr:SRPBCC family protein [Thermomicrobiales bacterium]
MELDDPIHVRVTRRFAAPAERVFDAFLDPALAGRFMFATPDGEMTRVEIDPRVGGTFVFTDRRDGVDVEHAGEFLELERPRRLAFSFVVDGGDSSFVIIDIVSLPDGCALMLTHEMDPKWADYAERTEQGWTGILAGVSTTLDDPGGESHPAL